ncbi:MAG: 2-hydroxyacyl-CoA dehydratase family protein [Oscillospiraceae bacterium]
MSYQKLFDHKISGEAAKSWRAEGKKAVGTLCCHIPVEILRAADVLPVRMRATGCGDSTDAEVWMSALSCSFARGILQRWMDGTYELDGMICSDGCMMPSRTFDNAQHINEKLGYGRYFQQIGAPRVYNEMGIAYFKKELQDLVEGLEKLSGNKVTDEKIKKFVSLYNEERALVKEVMDLRRAKNPVISGEDALKITLAACDIPVEEYIELLKELLADAKNRTPIKDKRARLMIIGSALDDPDYLKTVEDQGAIFVADALCYQSMAFTGQCEIDDNDVLGSLADFYLKRLVCPRMLTCRDELHAFILKACKDFAVDGIVYQKMQYCECCGGESLQLEKLLKEIDLPVLTVQREEKHSNVGQLAIRAEAFVEMVEKGE